MRDRCGAPIRNFDHHQLRSSPSVGKAEGMPRGTAEHNAQARTSSAGFTGTIRATRSMTFLFCSAFFRS